MKQSLLIKPAAALVLTAIILLVVLPSEGSEADNNQPPAKLSIGKNNLPETRPGTRLAEGVEYTEITRGYVSEQAEYTVEASLVNSREEAEDLTAELKEDGYQPKTDKVHNRNRKHTDVEDRSLGYIVQIGTFEKEEEAEELAGQASADGYENTNVTYSEYDGTNKTTGPWQFDVLEINPDQFNGELTNKLAHSQIEDRETISSIAGRTGAIAGINGGYFVVGSNDGVPGDPAGAYMTDGHLVSEAIGERTSLLLSGNEAEIAEVSTNLKMETESGEAAVIDGINRKPGLSRSCGGVGDQPSNEPMHDVTCTDSSEIIRYDDFFGETTPDGEGFEAVVDEAGEVTEHYSERGRRIPDEGTVLSATGEQAEWMKDSVSVGDHLAIDENVLEGGRPMTDDSDLGIIGGGPQLLNDGSIDIQAEEEGFRWSKGFYYRFAETRHPRSLAGIKENGNILLVTVDGRNPEESLGLTFYESAQVLQSLGAVEGMNLDGGGSSTMTVGEEDVNQPSDPVGERPVSDGILLIE
ncbi:phosphodiester glycosidase family protein [Halobacillus sp. A5]|uniref:phosphodiester glycosidase family protein n=1 Tax=Halobacillus sp. A5 TaxID=2880263 RepID=UPI0020A67F53|nr:phosphodiester glycosidase family protein [Halobacillus sp. A5]MCP3028613.1 phosphodiester glycosidase family protein [Halobacillus sp. A5]